MRREILFSSHILDDVEDIATSIGIIHKGRLARVGKPKDLQKELMARDGIEVTGPSINKKINQIQELSLVDNIEVNEDDSNKIKIMFVKDMKLDKAIIEIMDFFVKQQIIVHNFNYLKPSLEEVYLKYVMEDVPK